MQTYRKKSHPVEAARWNPPGDDGRPLLARDAGHPWVRGTSYAEVANHLGTSGCSPDPPYWDWSVMGVVETGRGWLFVSPGDWVVRDGDGDFRVFNHATFEATYEPDA